MGRVFILMLILTPSVALANAWKGIVYPNKDQLVVHVEIGHFKTLKECRSSIMGLLNSTKWTDPDYECGFKCAPVVGTEAYICEKTSR